MKKNIFRVLSLVLVAAMLFAFASCTQKLKVELRIVDAEGNDREFAAAAPANNNTPDAPATQATQPSTPATQPTQQPSSETPASETPASQTPASETPASQTPASETPASSETPANTVPSTKEEIVEFYRKAIKKLKNDAAGGFTKKEWQTIDALNVTGIGFVDSQIMNVAKGYFKDENTAEATVNAKGSDDVKNRINDFTLTDLSKVTSATLNQAGGNYEITIVLADEDTPHKGSSFLAQAGSVLLWEDIAAELENVSILSDYSDIHVWYRNYTITATMTPDGNFSALKHHCHISIDIGSAKVLVATLKNKNVTMENTVLYTEWKY